MKDAMEELSSSETSTILWDDDLEVPVFRWERFTQGEEFRSTARDWEEVIVENNATEYIVNTSEITAHDDDDKQWLAEVWVPDLIDHGVRKAAGVYGEAAISGMEMEKVEEKLSSIHPEYEFRVFPTEDEAKEWLRSQ